MQEVKHSSKIIILLLAFSSILISARGNQNISDNVDKLLQIADSVSDRNPNSAILMITDVLSSTKLSETDKFQLYTKAAEFYKNKQDYETSQQFYLKALQFARELNSHDLIVNTLLDIGRSNRRLGNYDKALEHDLEALKISELLGDKKLKSLIFNYIGIDHYRYNNFDEAILNFNRSLIIRQELNDSIGVADCYNNLGMVYDDIGKKDTALANYRKALLIYKKSDEYDGIAATYNNMAGIYYQLNNFEKVMDLMHKALEIRRQGGDKRKLSFTLLNIASLYYSQNNIDSSIKLNLEGLRLANEIGAKSQKKIAFEGLSDAYLKKGDYQKALEYQVLFTQVKDSIFEENKTRAIAEMQTKYETEKKEIENRLLKNENKVKSRNQLILAIIAVILLISVFYLVYYLRLRSKIHKQQKEIADFEILKREQEKKHLEDKVFAEKQINSLQKDKFDSELQLKSKQLASSTLNLVNKNEVLGELKNKISSLDSGQKEKSEIISYIHQNLDMDADWKKFRIDFEEAHPGFFDRLTYSYPDLSETYQKICAFLRIDLTSKEIADLLFVSVSAVNKNRQRLRKKLNLEAEADLNEFLKNI